MERQQGISVFDIGEYFETALKAAELFGTPLLTVPQGETLGFPPRSDNLESIYEEGRRLMAVTEIKIGEKNGESLYIDVFNTGASAPHTAFAVEYDDFKEAWKRMLSNNPTYCPNQEEEYIVGDSNKNKSHPDYVPANFLTWVFLRKQKTGPAERELIPIDLFDLIGAVNGNQTARKKLFQLIKNYGVVEEANLCQAIQQIYQEINRRVEIIAHILQDLYNQKILPYLNFKLKEAGMEFKPKKREDVATYMGVGFYRGDDQHKKDGLGLGPQSHPAFHIHSAIFPDLDEIQSLMAGDQRRLEKILSALNDSPNFKGRLTFLKPDEIDLKLFVKQVDPYSSEFFLLMKDWVVENLQEALCKLNPVIKIFEHHSKAQRLDQRFAEGWKITVSGDRFAEVMAGLSVFFKKMYNLWQEAKEAYKLWFVNGNEDELNKLKEKYNLPQEAIEALKRLLPTDQQLQDWKKEIDENDSEQSISSQKIRREIKRRFRIASKLKAKQPLPPIKFLISQVLDSLNQGYNLPGVPAFGISWYQTEDQTVFYISPLLSTKGVAEQYFGAPLNRQSA